MAELSELYSHAATVLPVTDLARARSFYADVLGFSVSFEWGDPPSYAVLRGGGVQIHLSVTDRVPEPDARATIVYAFVHDVDALHAGIAGRSEKPIPPPETTDYGMREFEVTDPDGHRMVFGRGI